MVDGGQVIADDLDGRTRRVDLLDAREQAALVGLPEGWAVLLPDGSYKLAGFGSGEAFWWTINNVRFAAGELDGHVPEIRRLPEDAPLLWR